MKTSHPNPWKKTLSILIPLTLVSAPVSAQQSPTANAKPADDEYVVQLSPFEVTAGSEGYYAEDTLGGTRLATSLSDLGTPIQVLTKDFLNDVGAVDNESLLAYALGTEVGGPRGNFSGGVNGGGGRGIAEENTFGNPNGNTRIRGLTSADNTRNYFLTNVPWDGYVVDRVDIMRGPNAILFGLGSPAGIINATTAGANLDRSRGELQLRTDQFGTFRASLNYNFVLRDDELALKVALLNNRQKFRQKPTYQDDQRVYAALKYKPDFFLNKNGKRLEITANVEHGEIQSNRPRTVPPISGSFDTFFASYEEGGAGGRTLDNRLLEDRQAVGGTDGRYINALGPAAYYIGNSLAPGRDIEVNTIHQYGAYDANGNRTAPAGSPFVYGTNIRPTQPLGRTGRLSRAASTSPEMSQWLSSGLIGESTLSDPTVFDFYNNSFEGPNRRETRDFDAVDVQLDNTFLRDRLGYSLAYHHERVDTSSIGIMGWFNTLYVDTDERLTDVSLVDGTVTTSPNPDVGRPYIWDQLRFNTSERGSTGESFRAQVFGEFDFKDVNDGVLGKILGRHRISGLYETQKSSSTGVSYLPAAFGPDFYAKTTGGSASNFYPEVRYYVGPDLRGRTSAAGAHLTGIQDNVLKDLNRVHTVFYWDPTWIGTAAFGDPWTDPDGTVRTESANPANYAGWKTGDYQMYTMLNPDQIVTGSGGMTAREYLRNGNIPSYEYSKIDSRAIILQSYLLDGGLVGTYGYREDEAFRATTVDGEPTNVFGGPAENKSWSVVAHANRLLGKRDFLPLNLSLYYSTGSNIQPLVGRIGADGTELPSPSGDTEEWSVLLATKDHKYSLRITDYETTVLNGGLSNPLAGQSFRIQQSLGQVAVNLKTIHNSTRDDLIGLTGDADFADRLINVIAPATVALFDKLETDYPGFVESWVRGEGYTFNNLPPYGSEPGAVAPNANQIVQQRGDMTQDAVSKGQEYSFTANPIPNWRITVNASKTTAIRDKVPGQSWIGPIETIDDAWVNTPAGEMPIFSFSNSPSQSVLNSRWNTYRAAYYLVRVLNGQSQPEIRKWHYNLVTNYSFASGRLNGVGVGGAVRYESPDIIEYPPTYDAAGTLGFDLDNPIKGEAETNFDFWVSYRRKLTEKMNLRMQLNLYNAFGQNKLIAVNTDPDGFPAQSRIKEGRSWQFSTTLEF